MPETPEQLEPIELRDACADDLKFLFSLYCDVRGPEVNAWGWPAGQRDAFLRMQFDAQRRSYLVAYPVSTHHIVCSGGFPIGRRLVAATPEGIRLVDIALVAACRNRGIGTRLIQQLTDECASGSSAVILQVLRGNPAQRLYRRIGFRESGADAMYITMRWTAADGRRD